MSKFTEEVEIKLKDTYTRNAAAIEKQTKSLTSTFATLKTAIGAFALIQGVKTVTSAYFEQEKSVQKLTQSLRGVGITSGDVSRRMQAFATSMQRQTVFTDEAIISQQAFLTSLKFSEGQIEKIIKASVDLSAATGMTLEGAVRNVAKTYAGLSGELSQLIPQLQGLTAEEMKAGKAVEVITNLFAGQAQSAAQTYGGKIQQISNNLKGLAEKIGGFTLKIVDQVGAIKLVSEAVDFWNDKLFDSGDEMAKLKDRAADISEELERIGDTSNRVFREFGNTADNLAIAKADQLKKELSEVQTRLSQLAKQKKSETTTSIADRIAGTSKEDRRRIESDFTKLLEKLDDLSLNQFEKIEQIRKNDILLATQAHKLEVEGARNKNELIARIDKRASDERKRLLMENVGESIGLIGQMSGDAIKNSQMIVGQIGKMFGPLGQQVAGIFNTVAGTLSSVVDMFDSNTKSIAERTLERINAMVSAMKQGFDELSALESDREKLKSGRAVDIAHSEGFDAAKDLFGGRLGGFNTKGGLRLEFDPSSGNIHLIRGNETVAIKSGKTGDIEALRNLFPGMSHGEDRTIQFFNELFQRFKGDLNMSKSAKGFAMGGLVPNFGMGATDDVNARLSGGEFVVKRSAVNSRTIGHLKRMNESSGQTASGGNAPIIIHAIDAASFKDFMLRTGAGVLRDLTRTRGLALATDRGITSN